jgi:hypothetical protein
MNYETDKASVYHFTMWFLYRRLFFALIIAFFRVSVVLQVYLSIMSSLVLLMYILKWVPFEADQYDFLAVFNECVLITSCYMMMLYTDYVPEPEMRYEFGNYFLNLLYFDVALNLLLLAYEITKLLKSNCKRFWYQRKEKKLRKLRV